VETDELDINQMTFGEFVRALEQAEKNGTREELERRLAEQLMPMIETVMAQPQQPPEGGATQ
jgi:tRNA A37 threonylcarbamoyladenosine modification protein TsaB